ncbi:MAG TPA: hypothetical protein VLV54_21175 [Thermoanaerobaculia bacterium]|nr:hypothetical protein [Thermoanaerobaculia bacterium]
MFIGHFALGLGAKRAAPAVSLGTLFLACQLADLLWPTLLLLGVEVVKVQPGDTAVTPLTFVSYPYSHSLVALLIWGIVFGAAYMLIRRSRLLAGVVLAALVVSHWILDVLTHRPDMPVTIGGSARLGLDLWDSLPATVAIELLLFAVGVGVYARFTVARDRRGKFGFWGLVGFLAAVYIGNLFGPPPPSATAVAWGAQALWLLVIWGYWVDRHRQVRV